MWRTDNTMDKKGRSRNVKDRQYNGQKRVEAVMWRTDHTMDKKGRSRNVKDRQYNGQKG